MIEFLKIETITVKYKPEEFDFFDGIFDGFEFLNPSMILAFITLFAAGGYGLENYTSWNSILVAGVSAVIAFILAIILNVFIFIPVKSAEQSLAYSDESLIGRTGKVVVPIPADGFGQIVIESNTGNISKAAVSKRNKEIKAGEKVIVVGVKQGSVIVEASINDLRIGGITE